MQGRGIWDARKEPVIAREIRREDNLLRILGFEMTSFCQKSHSRLRHWVVAGNQEADRVASFSRQYGHHFAGPGTLQLGVWKETGRIERPLTINTERVSMARRRIALFIPRADRGLCRIGVE